MTTQTWFKLYGSALETKERRLPYRVTTEMAEGITLEHIEDEETKKRLQAFIVRMSTGFPLLEALENPVLAYWDLFNFNVSRCFNCHRISVWIGDNLAWPIAGQAPAPNPDLPEDVRLDYDEASSILNLSPRGATALLRLAIQKLCKELGGKGKKIDDDIAELVKKGLDVLVQRALDIVRVTGNNAVHPGQVDLRDDRATAEKRFGLVNLIAERMITQPKNIAALYEGLPESSLKAIERRDGKTAE